MCSPNGSARRQAIPILYTRGTHYEVGFNMGRTFASMIKNYLKACQKLNEILLPLYKTPNGKQLYDDTLATVREGFPQYLRELEGVANGAEVEFFKLFLLHMDEILPQSLNCCCVARKNSASGCSSIIVNQNQCRLIGHTEDAMPETINHYYFVIAHIINDKPQGKYKVKEERFMSLCYAGHLPGFTVNYNHHGLVFTVNPISAKNLHAGKTPRTFLTRALLATCNMDDVFRVLTDEGVGVADACSANISFLNDPYKMCYSVEFAPCPLGGNKSKVCVKEIPIGNYNFHFNKFEGLCLEQADELLFRASVARSEAMKTYRPPVCALDVRNMLGDDSGDCFAMWSDMTCSVVQTICVVIFDLNAKTVDIFSDNPTYSEPLCTLSLLFN